MSSLRYHIAQRNSHGPCYVLGIMSGTSLDGIDLCVCEMSGVGTYRIANVTSQHHHPFRLHQIVAFRTVSFPSVGPFASLRDDLQAIMSGRVGVASSLSQLICRANFDWSRFVGQEILKMVNEELIIGGGEGKEENGAVGGGHRPFSSLANAQQCLLVGSHGQTVWHENNRHSTLQIGDTEVLAQVTGMVVVGNFRAADVAAGGCGAPLVPFFDRLVASTLLGSDSTCSGSLPDEKTTSTCSESSAALLSSGSCVAFQNLGGIGNVTFIYRPSEPSPRSLGAGGGDDWSVLAFDTGPANVALNEFLEKCYTASLAFVRSGDSAAAAAAGSEGKSCYCADTSALKAAESIVTMISDVLGPQPASFYDKDAAFSSRGANALHANKDVCEKLISELLDDWVGTSDAVESGGKRVNKAGGRFSAYLTQAPPKTAGREQFGAVFAEHLWLAYVRPLLTHERGEHNVEEDTCNDLMPAAKRVVREIARSSRNSLDLVVLDVICVVCRALVELTCISVADAYAHHLPCIPTRIVVSGGGKHHPLIMSGIRERLGAHLSQQTFTKGESKRTLPQLLSLNCVLQCSGGTEKGNIDNTNSKVTIDADDAKEAVAFAVLAHERLNSFAIAEPLVPLHSNVPSATGADRAVVLGQLSVPF